MHREKQPLTNSNHAETDAIISGALNMPMQENLNAGKILK
jgi:hypothetical protein